MCCKNALNLWALRQYALHQMPKFNKSIYIIEDGKLVGLPLSYNQESGTLVSRPAISLGIYNQSHETLDLSVVHHHFQILVFIMGVFDLTEFCICMCNDHIF